MPPGASDDVADLLLATSIVGGTFEPSSDALNCGNGVEEMFDRTNPLTVELPHIELVGGRRVSALQPVLDAIASLARDGSVVPVRAIRRQIQGEQPELTVPQLRHALTRLVEAGAVDRLGPGRYALRDASDSGHPSNESSVRGLPAPSVLRRAVANLGGHFCLDDIYAQARKMGAECSETSIRMAITAALRQPDPYMARVGRGVYRAVGVPGSHEG